MVPGRGKIYVEVIPLYLVVAGSENPLPTGEEPIGKDAREALRAYGSICGGKCELHIVKLHSHRNVCCLCGPTLCDGCSA